MKKKLLGLMIIVILVVMILTLTGCGNKKEDNLSNNKSDNIQSNYTNETANNQVEAKIEFDTSEYDMVKICSNNKIVMALKDKYYIYLDLNGNRITEKNYWAMDSTTGDGTEFIDGNVIVEDIESGLKGLLNENGTETIECKYKYIRYDEDEKLYIVDKDNAFPKDGAAYYINANDEKVKDW